MAGILYGVGVGPGDPELMTIKAVRVIRECEVIGIPAKDRDSCRAYQIAVQLVPEIFEKPVVAVPVPMTTDGERLAAAYGEGCERIIGQLKENRSVAFLNLGDPTVYGTYMEIFKRVSSSGFPGGNYKRSSSFCAGGVSAGRSPWFWKRKYPYTSGILPFKRSTGVRWDKDPDEVRG